MGSNKKSIVYDEKLFDKVIYYYINSYYNYAEIAQILGINIAIISKMVNNEEYISKYYGDEFLKEINDKRNIRQKVQKNNNQKFKRYLIKSIEHRNIVKEDVYFVKSQYGLELLDKVILFFQYKGNSVKMAEEAQLFQNDIQSSLSEPELKDILKEDVYEKLEVLLKYDKLITQNSLIEKKSLVETMISDVEQLQTNKGEEWEPTLPTEVIVRLLTDDSFVRIQYRSCQERLLNILQSYFHTCNYEKEAIDNPVYQLKPSTKG